MSSFTTGSSLGNSKVGCSKVGSIYSYSTVGSESSIWGCMKSFSLTGWMIGVGWICSRIAFFIASSNALYSENLISCFLGWILTSMIDGSHSMYRTVIGYLPLGMSCS